MSDAPAHDLARTLKLEGDRICNLIFHSDMDWIDIEIQINELRELIRAEAPEKTALFDAVYASRFSRLWDQWRLQGDTSWTWRDGDPGYGIPL